MNNQIDHYIANSKEFARPVLDELRSRVHVYCPDCVETMKWSMPFFEYKGKNLCRMAAFKEHCSFTFWLGSYMQSPWFKREGMGHFGKISAVDQLPDIVTFGSLIQEAMDLTDSGVILSRNPTKLTPLAESEQLLQALNQNPNALCHFEALSPGKKKEYHEWICGAKTATTAEKRINTAIEYLSDGKSLNWKYQK